ncbi:CLIP-associating protein 1-like isoform X1 [Xenia sp. Carnegie-2017]|uniref:CLIP-associating protein 1-like isoform X1 n=1 Tax=Xenia sp. Carnegie-2017 TaxID=2897299 RepID=UPI001F03591D|nr:CLIP-associating protein 1-like isoform X1 [Xenia sp. Carnegie-2017]
MDDYPELNSLLSMVQQNDTHKKIMASEELKKYLSNPLSPLTADAIDCLVDNFKIWINSGNYKISASGLELFTILIRRGGKSVKLNLNKVVPIIIDRLGDSKAVVRENSRSFLQELMHSFTPQVVLDLLIPAFSHKGFKVREEVMTCFMDSINVFGVTNLSISKFTPHICKLLGDANSQVRDNAIRTLVEIYRHVGEKVRIDLSKRGIPPTRLSLINSKFDEVLKSGTMIASATDGPPKANGDVQEPVKRREASVKLKKSNLRNEAKSEGSSTSGLAAGAVDENDFIRAYTDTPTVQIGSARELSDALTKISNALSSPSDDWEEHVAALKRVRSLVDGGSLDFDFMTQLKPLEGAFNAAVKSLRSAVAREACVTLSYLATKLGNKFGPVVDCILPTVIDLNANTATKVMASSGDTCAKIIIKNTHYPRLILHITTRMASRSTPVRIRCADYVVLLLEYWELHYLKSHVDELEKVVRNGLSDASSDVRAIIRKAFWQFSKLFKDKADKMFNDLDRSKQKLLEVDKKSSDIDHTVEKSTISSRGSIRTRPTSATSRVTRTDVVTNNKPTRLNSREASPGRRALPGKKNNSSTPSRIVTRSVSSVDARAAERARMRRRSRTEDAVKPSNYAPSDVRPRPSRSSSKVVHRGYMSQPASRSTSPSRLHFMFSPKERSNVYSTMASPLRSKIPTPNSRSASRCNSRASSRDPSPTRDRGLRSFSSSSLHGRKPSHVRRLDAKDFTEAAFWDALSKSPRPRNYSFNSTCSEEQDEGSDTSSVHSDRSSSVMTTLEISEITRLCQSKSWSGCDALTAIQAYLRTSRTHTHTEIVVCVECFHRFFYDPHNKVYSAFLDPLTDFMVIHKADLNEWLFILLTRLLGKLGGNLLASVHSKVVRVLDVDRDSFPLYVQFSVMTKYISMSEIPNPKTRVAILIYLQGLIVRLDAADFINSSETRLTASRLIEWNSDPKSGEVRKESANVVIALFELNTPIFSSMLPEFSKTLHETAKKLILNHLKKVDNDPRAYTSKSDVSNAKPPSSPGRLGYRSIPLAAPRHSSNGDDPVASVDVVSNELSPLQREDSATSLRSNESSESLEGKKACGNPPENSPSITSSGYHSDEIHTNDTVINNSSRHVLHSEPKLPISPSFSVSKNTEYDASRYQDETSRVSTDTSVNGVDTIQDNVTVSLSNESSDTFNKGYNLILL